MFSLYWINYYLIYQSTTNETGHLLFFDKTLSIANQICCTKMKFSIKEFFSTCDQIRRKLRIRSHLLKKFFMKNLTFCPVVEAIQTVI